MFAKIIGPRDFYAADAFGTLRQVVETNIPIVDRQAQAVNFNMNQLEKTLNQIT